MNDLSADQGNRDLIYKNLEYVFGHERKICKQNCSYLQKWNYLSSDMNHINSVNIKLLFNDIINRFFLVFVGCSLDYT